jgi:hypothetical protein
VFVSVDPDSKLLEVDIVLLQQASLAGSETVAVGDQEHSTVAFVADHSKKAL